MIYLICLLYLARVRKEMWISFELLLFNNTSSYLYNIYTTYVGYTKEIRKIFELMKIKHFKIVTLCMTFCYHNAKRKMRVKSGRFERVMEITLHNTDKCMKLKPIWAFACNFSPQAYFYLLLRYFSYFVFLRWSTRYMCLWVLSSVCFKNQQPNMNLNDHLGNMDTRCSCLCKSLK